MRQVVQVADVVTLKFEACAVPATPAQYGFDVAERVLENQVAAVLHVLALPIVLQRLVFEAAEHREQAEIHRTHV